VANNFAADPGCVALWRFESGALTADSIGGNTLTNNGVSEATGAGNFKEGSCAGDFEDSQDDYMTIADASLDAGFPLKSGDMVKKTSVAFWCKFERVTTTNMYIFSKYNITENKRSFALSLGISDPNVLHVYYGYNNGANYETMPLHYPQAGRWYHIGIACDGVNKTCTARVWDDTAGEATTYTKNWTNEQSVADVVFALGARRDLTSSYEYDGILDEFAVFNRILSVGEFDQIRTGTFHSYEESILESLDLSDVLRYFAESVEESLILTDRIPQYEGVVEDTIHLEESFHSNWSEAVNDDVDLADADTLGLHYYGEIAEEAEFSDSDSYAYIANVSLTDTVFIYDNALPGWAKTVLEGVNLADAPLPVLGIRVSDWLTLRDSQSNNWDGTEMVAPEGLNLYDLPYGARVINRSIAESVQLADNITLQWIVGVLDYMRFSDLATVVGLFNHSAADTLRLTDEARRAFDKLIADVLALVDTAAVLISFMPSLAESLGLADASSCVSAIGKVVSDALVMTDQTTSGLSAYCLVQDAIALNVIIDIDGETYECYVLNTPKFFPSVYSGFDFNSYCMFEGKTYGANSTGIYELTGDTDAGETINTGVVLSQTTFGVPDRKKLRRAWLGISGTQPMLMLEVEDGTRRAYAIDTRGEVGSDRDISGKKWKLSVTSFDELDFIKILPVALAG
jgi:hypothetical protein